MCAWTLTWRIKRTLETMKAFHSGKSRNDEARKQERVLNYLDLTRTYSEYSCIQMQRWKDRTRPKARNLCCRADINVKRYRVESHEKNLFFFCSSSGTSWHEHRCLPKTNNLDLYSIFMSSNEPNREPNRPQYTLISPIISRNLLLSRFPSVESLFIRFKCKPSPENCINRAPSMGSSIFWQDEKYVPQRSNLH